MGAIDYNLSAWGPIVDVSGSGGCLCGGCDAAVDADGTIYISRVVQGGAVHVASSSDRGATWVDCQVVAGGVEFYRHASALVVDAAGTVHLFYVDAGYIPQHARSFDEGATWGIQAVTNDLDHCSRQLDAVSTGTRLVLLLRDDDDGSIYLVISDDSGVTWNGPRLVATALPHLGWAIHMRLAMDASGHIYVLSEAIIEDQRETFITRSADSGVTWKPWSKDWNAGQAMAASLHASGRGQLVIVYVSGQTLTAALSTNGGHSWVSRSILTSPLVFDLWSPPGLLKDPNGTLHVFVYLGTLHTIRHVYSTNNGNTWIQGDDVFTAASWKTPADIQPIWANGNLAVATTIGISTTVGKVQFVTGDIVVIHQTPRLRRVEPDFIASGVGNHFYLMDAGETGNGSIIPSVLERVGLTPEGPGNVVTILEVWPDCSMNTDITIQVGSQMSSDEMVHWHPPVVLNPYTADYVPVRVTGRFIAVRFIIDIDCQWAMHGYTLVYEQCGRY
ncbi:MAG: exo-alpha-sialidase [Magnetococcales bacterium]|nr:exo-alpha-sialidase [Magnetococcales bacterium]